MRVAEDGQITIPKQIRDQAGLGPDTEVEFELLGGDVVLRKKSPALSSETAPLQNLEKWKGHCGERFAELGYTSVDEFIEDIRGR